MNRTTMQRAFALLLAAMLLTACRPVTVPQLPAPKPTPNAVVAFLTLYEALDVPYKALSEQFATEDYSDPIWRATTVERAAEWRAAIGALQAAEQPEGEKWAAAWPVIQQALGEYEYVAAAVGNAAAANDPTLTLTARGRLVDGVNLMYEAMRLLK